MAEWLGSPKSRVQFPAIASLDSYVTRTYPAGQHPASGDSCQLHVLFEVFLSQFAENT